MMYSKLRERLAVWSLVAMLSLATPALAQGQYSGAASTSQTESNEQRSTGAPDGDPVTAILKWLSTLTPVEGGMLLMVLSLLFGGMRASSGGGSRVSAKPNGTQTKAEEDKK